MSSVGRCTARTDSSCVPSRAVYRLPDALSDDVAVLTTCNVATAYSAVRQAAAAPGSRVAILGLGGVGLSALIVAAADVLEVTAVDPLEDRRAVAAASGAASVLDPADFHASIGSRPAHGFSAVLECSGHPSAQADATGALMPGGRAVVVGGGRGFAFRAEELMARELSLIGSSVCPADLFYDVLDFAAGHQRELGALLGPTFDIANAERALRHTASVRAGKPIFKWPHSA